MNACRLVEWVLLFTLFGSSLGSKTCCRGLKEKKIVPNYAKCVKTTSVKVRYGDKIVECRDKVLVNDAVLQPPTVRFDVCGQCENVTLLAFSPDNLIGAPYLRWLVLNIPACEIKKGFNSGGSLPDKGKQGDVKAVYNGPKDPQLGEDRENKVVIFIYCQCRYIADTKPYLTTDRFEFDIKKYAEKNGLKCPVAGFFYFVTVNPVKVPVNPETVPLSFSTVPTPTLPVPIPV